MKKIDYHLHTSFSLDSDGQPEDYIRRAILLQLDEICFTDHYDVDYPGADFTMDIPFYLQTMRQLQTKYQDQIKIFVGIEMGLDPLHQQTIEAILQQYHFDFVIGSVHAIGQTEFFRGDFFKGLSKEEAHRQYFEQCIACVNAFDDFDVFGHFDYIERYGPYQDKQVDTSLYEQEIETFLKRLIEKNKGLEVNTSGFLLRQEGFPKRSILERYYALGGRKISIGSDSHTAKTVGAHVTEVLSMLQAIGFQEVGIE